MKWNLSVTKRNCKMYHVTNQRNFLRKVLLLIFLPQKHLIVIFFNFLITYEENVTIKRLRLTQSGKNTLHIKPTLYLTGLSLDSINHIQCLTSSPANFTKEEFI